jgi:hypothetical protein
MKKGKTAIIIVMMMMALFLTYIREFFPVIIDSLLSLNFLLSLIFH